MSNLLEIENLKLSFLTPAGEVRALSGVSLNVGEGEVLGIVGESGSGKSVTSYAIMRLIPQNGRVMGGSVTFDGQDLLALTEREMRKIRGNHIGMIFQDPMTSLNPVYSVGNQIMETLKIHTELKGKAAKARAGELLELVGINDPYRRLKQYPHELSGGMRQRVMIAMALACEPKLLIADEPTTALDVTIQAQILELMGELRRKIGMSIILITHDLGIVAGMCDNIAVMYAGRIVELGGYNEIFYDSAHEYTKGLLRSLPDLNNEQRKLIPIEGAPIDLLNQPPGCPFAPRCEAAMNICVRAVPPSMELAAAGHRASCWLNHEECARARRRGNG
ncbi:MAG: ABC transporter ATP-binding protein [Clostridiales bacterium]|jgi:oligopeptide transport system ATP-binding protein|nr:ABC transporter ATP-binding protein [Clostridiales bacterium]